MFSVEAHLILDTKILKNVFIITVTYLQSVGTTHNTIHTMIININIQLEVPTLPTPNSIYRIASAVEKAVAEGYCTEQAVAEATARRVASTL